MGPLSEVPLQVRNEFARSIGVFAAEMFNPMLMESLVILLIGLGVTVFGVMRGRAKKSAVPPVVKTA
jgi:hypothetical protein